MTVDQNNDLRESYLEAVSVDEIARRMTTQAYLDDQAVSTSTLDRELRRLAASR